MRGLDVYVSQVRKLVMSFHVYSQGNGSTTSQTSSETSLPEVDQSGRACAERLQQENSELRARDADNTALVRQLRSKIQELEHVRASVANSCMRSSDGYFMRLRITTDSSSI